MVKIKDYNKDKSQRKPDKEATIVRMSEEELDEAKLFIYRQLQRETYPKAFENLQMEGSSQGEDYPSSSNLVSKRQINYDQWKSLYRTER